MRKVYCDICDNLIEKNSKKINNLQIEKAFKLSEYVFAAQVMVYLQQNFDLCEICFTGMQTDLERILLNLDDKIKEESENEDDSGGV